jgi:two-component system CheB/CheR fusion protein
VVGNLLHNAAKFTPRGGHATLSVGVSPEGAGLIRVRDDGAGMSPATLAHAFEPFVQDAQGLARSLGGLGLGLALVKGLVGLHGGAVAAASEGEGRGSELTVTLPLLSAPAPPERVVVPAGPRPAVMQRVLVIEDNVDAAESLREALELGPREVAIANTGPDGIAAARAFKPDVVVCDIGLPGLDGYGVARALRADPDPRLRSSYLVALSGYAFDEDVARALQAGFDRHLAKPPSLEALEALLVEAMERAAPG